MALPSLAAGVFLALSLPPFGFWILALPGAGLLWWRLGRLSVGGRLLSGWMAGLGLFVPGLWWALSFNLSGGIILMVVQALTVALAAMVVPAGRGRTAALAGAMVLFEALRSAWPFGGLPLGGIALGQADGPLADAARLGGPLLLVGLVWLAGAGVAGLAGSAGLARQAGLVRAWPLGREQDGAGPPRRTGAGRPRAAVLALAGVVALATWGALAADGGGGRSTVRVAAVQGGGVRGLRKAEVSPASVFAAQLAATRTIAAADGGQPPDLVVWPEDVVSLDELITQSPAEATLAAVARRLRSTLTVGVTETVSATAFRNEIVAFSPSGRLVARFEKVHRVPFGEYIPDRAFFSHLANLSAVPLDAIAGHGDGVLHTPAAALGTMVSYEVFFAARGRIATRAGARLLIVPTNTASYSTSQVPTQEIAASRLQAIAEGRDLVQASPTGFSAIINHDGTVLARTSLGQRQVLVGDVRLRTGLTLYERFGDLPVLLGAGALLVGGWGAALTGDEPGREAEGPGQGPTSRRKRNRPAMFRTPGGG